MLKSALTRLSRAVSSAVLLSAQAHFQAGDVLTFRLSDGLLRARVKGKNHQIFDVYMDLKGFPNTPSNCRCERKNNCEHAIAALYALDARESESGSPHHIGGSALTDSMAEQIIKAESVEWYSDSKSQGHDFFGYQLGILIDNKKVSIVPLVANLLKQFDPKTIHLHSDEERFRLPLSAHKLLEVNLGRLKPLLRMLWQYGVRQKDFNEEHIKLSRYQLLFMEEAELAIHASQARWHGTKKLASVRRALLSYDVSQHENFDIHLPASNITLRDYQKVGVQWLKQLADAHLGGILADDMGLGKTLQTLVHLQNQKNQGRMKTACLILAPRSVMNNWVSESKKFTPDLKIKIHHGFGRHEADDFEYHDIVVSTYGIAQRDKTLLLKHKFHYLILDEAQIIKNTETKTRQIIQQFRAKHRLCLTGTPLENHLGELWSLFHFLAPGFLGNLSVFRKTFQYPIEREQNQEMRELLIRRLQPFVLRRTKSQVALELPKKTEITQEIELIGGQRDLYESIRMTSERSVQDAIASQGLGKGQWIFLEALLKLRQVCCDPKLLSNDLNQVSSAKLKACLSLLDNLMSEGRSVLIFSQFTSMLTFIEQALEERGYSYLTLTGKTKNREALIHRFQQGDTPIFLISLRAGGVGLNLTKADTVIHYDPWWNPAVETQATDRTHRIGQNKPVFVYRLIAKGTVEEVMSKMQSDKKALFDNIFSGERLSGNHRWTEDEIEQFFMPISGDF